MSTVSIPAFHVSDKSKVKGVGEVFINTRVDILSSGIFTVEVDVHFDPDAEAYPTGTAIIEAKLSDGAHGKFEASSVELVNSYGKHNPTVFITGRCKENVAAAKGCRYWLMIVHNKNAGGGGTPDIVSFVIHDRHGERIAYGTGPLRSGDFEIEPK